MPGVDRRTRDRQVMGGARRRWLCSAEHARLRNYALSCYTGSGTPPLTRRSVSSRDGRGRFDPARWEVRSNAPLLPLIRALLRWPRTLPFIPSVRGAAERKGVTEGGQAAVSCSRASLSKGGFCAELAQHGRQLLSQGRVRYYTGSGTTLRSWGGPSVGIIMDDGFVSNPTPYHHGFALAHELEHAYTDYQHTAGDADANGVHRTPHDGLRG
jgi:hypothetical protein